MELRSEGFVVTSSEGARGGVPQSSPRTSADIRQMLVFRRTGKGTDPIAAATGIIGVWEYMMGSCSEAAAGGRPPDVGTNIRQTSARRWYGDAQEPEARGAPKEPPGNLRGSPGEPPGSLRAQLSVCKYSCSNV